MTIESIDNFNKTTADKLKALNERFYQPLKAELKKISRSCSNKADQLDRYMSEHEFPDDVQDKLYDALDRLSDLRCCPDFEDLEKYFKI